jgi:hypothetical protein
MRAVEACAVPVSDPVPDPDPDPDPVPESWWYPPYQTSGAEARTAAAATTKTPSHQGQHKGFLFVKAFVTS